MNALACTWYSGISEVFAIEVVDIVSVASSMLQSSMFEKKGFPYTTRRKYIFY